MLDKEKHPHACGEDFIENTMKIMRQKHPHACGEDIPCRIHHHID
jgi:hypothetical protein